MKIGIIGSGFVGATSAYAMVMRGVGREIVLVDLNEKRALAEAEDLFHAVPFANPLYIRDGGYQDLKGAQVVVVAAGVSQKPGETRLQLLGRNAAVFRSVIPSILEHAPDAVLLIATNPVDIMTHVAAIYAERFGIPSSRVIGSGTTLDTARFRTLLGRHLRVDPQHVHGYVVGEHGDSEVLVWSQVTVGCMSLEEFANLRDAPITPELREEIDHGVRKAAYRIIEGKGATYYGIGAAIARIAEAIIRNQRAVLTVSARTEEIAGIRNVCLSVPRLVGGSKGILADLPLPMNQEEEEAMKRSASILKNAMDELLQGGI